LNNFVRLVKRIINRSSIIIKDYYIDLSIQKRFIGDRRINSTDPESGVHQWHSTSYDAIDKIFCKNDNLSIKQDDVIIDVGCADGKVFNLLLYRGFKNKMIGYEINTKHGLETKKALKNYKNVQIICEDIFDNFPSNGSVFYLFNPFGEKMMGLFIENLIKIRSGNPIVIYNYPLLVHLFDPLIFNVSIIPLHQYRHAYGKYALIDFK
jgi:hypothetical protein